MRARLSLFATIAVVAAGGCKDVGLPDRNLPIEQAAHRPPDALVQAVHAGVAKDEAAQAEGPVAGTELDTRAVRVGDQEFVASGTPQRIPEGALEPIGSVGGAAFHAVKGDAAPYGRIYMAHPGGQYVEYMPLYETGDPNARQAVVDEALASGGGGSAAAH